MFADSAELDETIYEKTKKLISERKYDEILLMADHTEREWATKADSRYSVVLKSMCSAIRGPNVDAKGYAILQQIVGRLISKEPEEAATKNPLLNQFEVIEILLSLNAITDTMSDSERQIIRSRNFRMAMVYMQRWRKIIIPNYRMKPASMNILPAGVDLEDEKVMQVYREKIIENEKNAKSNLEQGVLKRIEKKRNPIIERAMVEEYSKRPIDYQELSDFLFLGQYPHADRLRILLAVERKSGENIPLFLAIPKDTGMDIPPQPDTPAAKDEKN